MDSNNIVDYIKDYCRLLLGLINKLLVLSPNDNELLRIRNQMLIAKNTIPSSVLDLTGPYLLKYKDEIRQSDIKYFMTTNLLDANYDNKKNYETVAYMIKKIRQMNNSSDIENYQKDEFISIIKKLLLLYCKYIIELKKQNMV